VHTEVSHVFICCWKSGRATVQDERSLLARDQIEDWLRPRKHRANGEQLPLSRASKKEVFRYAGEVKAA
jgi:hypothetical protein